MSNMILWLDEPCDGLGRKRVYFECGDYLNSCYQGEENRILFSSLYLSPLLSVCSKEKQKKKKKDWE